ncbi:hypothetical protein HC031_08875 [Planosporangium thailandense]|uniref:Integral membrane protein n=1 Tax=Planosporangium thailandense TaxID=765197 RepID=A0ABX0XXB9_9ACTN|nr:hypothetical protein [Planosporangium thailandense]NJC69833.1 hypothetical protein [Planosporangium thailandense]
MSLRRSRGYPATEAGYDGYDEYDEDLAPTPAEPVRRSAPASVRVAALVGYLAGLALIAIGAGAWTVWAGGDQALGVDRMGLLGADLRDVGPAGGLVYVFAGLLVLAVARRLHRGRQWVRVLVVAGCLLSIGVTLYVGLVGRGGVNVFAGLVLPVVYVVLLNLPTARSWYRDRY